MFSGLRPDITPAQVVALVGAVIAVLVSAGLDISDDLRDSVLQLVAILAGLLLVSDAGLRSARNLANRKVDVVDAGNVPDGDNTQAERQSV